MPACGTRAEAVSALGEDRLRTRQMHFFMRRHTCYLLIGAPGCGKGTQGNVLGAIPGYFHLDCGEVFRALDIRTPIGRKFAEFSSKGLLVPDELTIELWVSTINALVMAMRFRPDLDALVLDGIPRSQNQAKLMETLIDVQHCFHLSCPDREELILRLRKRALHENRLDDANESVIRKRLETYECETKPILEYYRKKITVIDATKPPIEVAKQIINAIATQHYMAAA